MTDIDEKLGKSLDDLIKEASKKRQSTGGSAGPGRRSTSAGGKRFRRSGRTSADEMDVDDGGGKGSALGASGGVAKKRYSGGSIPAKSSSKQISIDTPKGNINGQWKHDLHHQLQHDDGPARTRKLMGHKAGRKPEVLRVIELSKVPSAVTVEDIADLCETVVKAEDVLHVEERTIGHSLKMTIEFSSESAASIFFQKYRDIVLDGVPLEVKRRGMSVPTVLRSGVTVSTKQQSARRQIDSHGAVRGRGQSGRMRSDCMDG